MMKQSTVKKLKQMGLNPKDYTVESPESLVGHIVVTDPGKETTPETNLFKVTGGFGAEMGCRGTGVFVTRISDGVEGRVERYQIIARKKEEANA
jgi:hypothetical protein